jgi:hypothetical protein
MWMSREEMTTSMRRAMEPQRGEEKEHDYATQEQHKGEDVVHQNSMNSIITECMEVCLQNR